MHNKTPITKSMAKEAIAIISKELGLLELTDESKIGDTIILRDPDVNDEVINTFRDINNFISATYRSIVQDIFTQEQLADIFSEMRFRIDLRKIFKDDLFSLLHYNPRYTQEVYIVIDNGDYYKICGKTELGHKKEIVESIIPKELFDIYNKCENPDDCDEIITVINGYVERAVAILLGRHSTRLIDDIYQTTKHLAKIQHESRVINALYDKYCGYVRESDNEENATE